MTTRAKAGFYFAFWVPAAVVAIVVEGVAIDAFNAAGIRGDSWPVTLGLNLVPALAAGLVLYVPAALWANRDRGFGGWRGHFFRGAGLYLLVIVLGILMALESSNSDFWLYGQLILWPGLVAVSGILADLAAWALGRAARQVSGLPT